MEDAQMPWPPNLRSQSPAYSEGLSGSRKVSIAARLQQTKSKKAMPVVTTKTVAIQKKADPRPPLLPCPLLAEVAFSFLFALLNLVSQVFLIYGDLFLFLIIIL